DKAIEESLSSSMSIEMETKNNIRLLLNDTAFHFKMVENIINTLSAAFPNFVLSISAELNTEERRDAAYSEGLKRYLKGNQLDQLDFDIIDRFFENIISVTIKEQIISVIINRFYREKDDSIPYLVKLKPYYDLIPAITKIISKCDIIVNTIKLLNLKRDDYHFEIGSLLEELYNSWTIIDVQWSKINIGYSIAKDLADYSSAIALKYLNDCTELKNNEIFSSHANAEAYIRSIRLTIRSFCGILAIRENVDDELKKIENVISQLDSTGERLVLWSELSLRVNLKGKKELFIKIFKDYITPLLKDWGADLNDSYRSKTISLISPTLYAYNRTSFLAEYFEQLSDEIRDKSVVNILDYFLTECIYDDPVSDKKNAPKIDYGNILELCDLLSYFSNDYILGTYITKIIDAIKDNRLDFSKDQIGVIRKKLNDLITTKLPSTSKGIKHDGYQIIAQADLLSLDSYDANKLNLLVTRAKSIPNVSDKALTLIYLADAMPVSNSIRKRKLQILEEAFNIIKLIPSIYDKSNRFDATWDTFLDIDRGKFHQYLKLAYQDLLSFKDGELSSLRDLIDVAQQHDPKLAQEFVTMLDQDPARRKLKKPMQDRLDNKAKIKNATENYDSMGSLSTKQFVEVTHKYLEGINSGTRVSKDIDDIYSTIEKASTLSLEEAFESYMYFVENANKRYELTKKNPEYLSLIFNALLENTKLIGILSSDNLAKMKNLYKLTHDVGHRVNPIFNAGEKDEALKYIKDWLGENIDERLYIIDPYFSEKDLKILLWVKEFNPDCQVFILTGKELNRLNDHKSIDDEKLSSNSDVYNKAWKDISSEEPVATSVRIVWDKETIKCPFHDRWYVVGAGEIKSCAYIGTSINGLGSRDSQITVFSQANELAPIEKEIETYIFRKEKRVAGFHLKYEDFDLE
ncbi:hypothetical protein, partial [Chryseobacterium aquaticum]|uniref:hypothetical protein n=1 Tax=Chryseobacterium aquaticum TaxID=452084 RepID=UPI002FCB8811